MTEALTKVDEKVGNFNQQVQLLNQSQEGITKILAGVKKYGTLAEFSLDALIKDLLLGTQGCFYRSSEHSDRDRRIHDPYRTSLKF